MQLTYMGKKVISKRKNLAISDTKFSATKRHMYKKISNDVTVLLTKILDMVTVCNMNMKEVNFYCNSLKTKPMRCHSHSKKNVITETYKVKHICIRV